MSAHPTQALATFASTLEHDRIPESAREYTKDLLLDALAAWGTPMVKFHQCRGALSGLMAALLAEQGFVATQEFLTAKDGGLYNTYTNGGKPEVAVAGLGERWELGEIALRLWPSASTTQGLITALFDLIEQHQIDAGKVRKVRVGMSAHARADPGEVPHLRERPPRRDAHRRSHLVCVRPRERRLGGPAHGLSEPVTINRGQTTFSLGKNVVCPRFSAMVLYSKWGQR